MMFDPGTFRSPPARFRLKPFWFWNLPPAELTTERLERAIEDMAAHGLGGFVIFNKKDWGFNRDNFLKCGRMEGRHRMVARVTNTSANRFEEAPQKSGLLRPLRVFVD